MSYFDVKFSKVTSHFKIALFNLLDIQVFIITSSVEGPGANSVVVLRTGRGTGRFVMKRGDSGCCTPVFAESGGAGAQHPLEHLSLWGVHFLAAEAAGGWGGCSRPPPPRGGSDLPPAPPAVSFPLLPSSTQLFPTFHGSVGHRADGNPDGHSHGRGGRPGPGSWGGPSWG